VAPQVHFAPQQHSVPDVAVSAHAQVVLEQPVQGQSFESVMGFSWGGGIDVPFAHADGPGPLILTDSACP
jgi:hypothetical protein